DRAARQPGERRLLRAFARGHGVDAHADRLDAAVSFAVSAVIPRPVEEVFDHVVEPGLISSYFTSEASGPLIVGAKVTWSWPDGRSETIDVEEVETNRRVVFFRRQARKVTILLEALDPNRTQVTIEEDGA